VSIDSPLLTNDDILLCLLSQM